MQPQGNTPEEYSQRRGEFHISNPYPVSGVDIGPQPGPYWFAYIVPPGPTYGPDYQGVLDAPTFDPPTFPPRYPGPYGRHHGQLAQTGTQSQYGVSQPTEGRDSFFPPGVNPAIGAGYNNSEWEDPGHFSRFGLDPGGPIHLTTNISAASPQVSYQSPSGETNFQVNTHIQPNLFIFNQLLQPIEKSPTQMSNDSSSLFKALGPEPSHEKRPKSAEGPVKFDGNSTDSVETDIPASNETKAEKDRERQRKRREREEEEWNALRGIFGEGNSKYDLLCEAAMILGITVRQKKPACRRRAAIVHDLRAKEERRRMKKNENGREGTAIMATALKIIEKHFGMKKPTRREILARLVEEARSRKELEDESHADITM